MTSKKQRRLQRGCQHVVKTNWVTFKNGAQHLEKRCRKCKKFFGYQKQHAKADDPVRIEGLEYEDELPEFDVMQRTYKRPRQSEFVFRG